MSSNSNRTHHLPDDATIEAPVMSVVNLYGTEEERATVANTMDLEGSDYNINHDDSYSRSQRANNRKYCLMMTLLGVIVVALCSIVGVTLAKNAKYGSGDAASITAPVTSLAPFTSLEEYYDYVLGVVELNDDITNLRDWTDIKMPHFEAIEFLVYQDAGNGLVLPDRASIEQRLALLLSYFATGGTKTWANDEWVQASVHECEWDSVECSSNSTVTRLRLSAQASMTNRLPVETFVWLPHLEVLDVSQNRLSGAIPDSIWELSKLEFLDLSKNQFSGTITSDMSSLSSLTYFSVFDNLMTGKLPLKLPAPLETLEVDINSLTGTIPDSWFDSSFNMHSVNLNFNRDLTGSIPTSIGLWANLERLDVKRCYFNGTVPSEIGNLKQLEFFSLSDNRFSGEFPFAEFLELPLLSGLLLAENGLSGTIPADSLVKSAQHQSLVQWNMVYNNFAGTLPSELGLLTTLQYAQFSNNNFSGTIPAELEAWQENVKTLWLHGNDLDGQIPCPDEGNNFDGKDWRADCSSNPFMECECCNMCF